MKKQFVILAAGLILSLCRCGTKNLEPNMSTPPFIIDSHMHYEATDEWEKSFLDIYGRHNAMACLLIDMEDLDQIGRAHV